MFDDFFTSFTRSAIFPQPQIWQAAKVATVTFTLAALQKSRRGFPWINFVTAAALDEGIPDGVGLSGGFAVHEEALNGILPQTRTRSVIFQ